MIVLLSLQNVFVLLTLVLNCNLIYPLHHPKTNHPSGSTSFVASLKTLFGSTLTEVSLLNDFLSDGLYRWNLL
jgi:hypothetical protein